MEEIIILLGGTKKVQTDVGGCAELFALGSLHRKGTNSDASRQFHVQTWAGRAEEQGTRRITVTE